MTNKTRAAQWPHVTELLDQVGGHISIGRMPPIEGAAVAVNEQTLVASLVRRDGETFSDLLQRLDTAIGKALHDGVTTNEINGGRFRLAASSVRQKALDSSVNPRRTYRGISWSKLQPPPCGRNKVVQTTCWSPR